tara:strand:+ start:1707 stop:2741 length:1035 start_codon:yes stop_codon:yes gene_type:complete
MANQSKFEAMLEKLIAEDKAGAEELFHEIVVEKSRSIYEDLLETDTAEVEVDEAAKDDAKDEKVEEKEEAKDEDKVEEASKEDDAEDKVEEKADADKDEDVKEATDEDEKTDEATEEKDVEENFADQITPEGDDEMGGDAADDMIADIEDDGEGEEDKGDDEDLEDRVVDLEDALDDLKAEFDGMMSDKDGDEDKGEDDMEMDMDAGDDEGDEEKEDEAVVIAPESDLEQPVAFENAEKPVQSSAELMREYVSKVAPKMGDAGTDGTKSPVAGKNDMGGEASNIAQGGEETGGKAQAPKEDSAGNVNVPGGKASKSMSKDSKGHGAEKKGAGESGADSKSTIGS